MPRNRQAMERDAKVEEILVAAEDALRSGGYDALTFNAIAKELGLARGAIYWYFPSKDELLVAVAASAFSAAMASPPKRSSYLRRIAWAVEKLADLQPINNAVHERARHSDAVAEFDELVQRELCAKLRDLLRPHVAASRLEEVAEAIVVFVQGLLALPLSRAERERRLQFIVETLVSAEKDAHSGS